MIRPRTIRFQLLVAVNTALALPLFMFLVIDYRREIADRVAEKHLALREEAKTLLPAVLRISGDGHEAVQKYVDAVCGRMRDAVSPGHHIVVCLDETVLQALAHDRSSPEIFEAMQAAARSPSYRAKFRDEELVVGIDQQGDVTALVSEYVTNIRRSVNRQILQRLAQIALLAVVAAGIINFVFLRMTAKPLEQLVNTVRRIGQGELGAQTGPFNSEEFTYLAEAVNSMSASLAETDRYRRQEMARARRIQESLLPKQTDTPGLTVAHLYQPVEDVAGDYYDLLALPDGTWLVCIADVTGHGVPAALSATMLKALLLHASHHHTDPGQILGFVNQQLTTVCRTENLASMFLAQCNPEAMTLEYASAGHETGLLLSTTGRLRELRSTGLLLAVLEDATWQTETLPVSRGDKLLMVTDGVTEATNGQGELFGRRRLAHQFMQCSHADAAQTVGQIEKALAAHGGAELSADDMTLVVVEFTPLDS